MTKTSGFALVIFVFLTTSVAQGATCQAGKNTVIGRSDGISYGRVNFVGAEGEIGASVLTPTAKGKKLSGVIISHLSVVSKYKKADMLRLAWALSRTGAASIIFDGTAISPVSDNEAERIHRLVPCAAEWLVENAKVDGNLVAAIAPEKFWQGWSGSEEFCATTEQPCWPIQGGVGYPQADVETIVLRDFRITADFLQGLLKLDEIKPEWLAGVVETTTTANTK